MSILRLIICIGVVIVGISSVSAQTDIPVNGVLNPDFAQQQGVISTVNQTDEAGIFVLNPDGEVEISILLEDVVAVSHQYLGGFLVAYDESGQALFELPQGGYQMQLTTSNGAINFSYLNQNSNVQSAEILTMQEDMLLQASADGHYQLYLLTTGELRVVMGPDAAGLYYHVTFTGIPALNIKQAITSGISSI
jgi:hypothetical protein